MRINQFVAAATGTSRRTADKLVAAGSVTIDGKPVPTGAQVEDDAPVMLDGKPLKLPARHTYVALNKPAGYVSSRAHQGKDPNVYDLLPKDHHRLRLVGRLDRDSSGLVILSDDGAFIQRYAHPSFNKSKEYELTLSRPVTTHDQLQLESGVMLDDGLSQVRVLETHGRRIRVSLQEGRNRQLRRTFGALGFNVERLHRTTIGPYRLGDLAAGSWRFIKPADKA